MTGNKITASAFAFFILWGCAAAFAPPARAADAEEFAAVMRAMFRAEFGAPARAAAEFAELAEEYGDPDLMREAYRDALKARDSGSALRYAARWRELGGGAESLRAAASLLLAGGRGDEASPALFALKEAGASDEELFDLLKTARKQDALPLARSLLGDTAAGNLFKSRLAARFGEWDAAAAAAARGLEIGADEHRTELHFARMRAAGRGDAAALAPVLDAYIARECPGGDVVCREADVLYAFALFAADRDWREGADADDVALAAGRFYERAELPARARPHYERLRGKMFQADLGLARILRAAGDAEGALAILSSARVADDREFGQRETTAAEIVRELRGAEEALSLVVRARRASPENRDLMYEHSLLSEQIGDVQEAVAVLEQMTGLFPKDADAWNALGYVLADHALRLDDAEKFIKKALSLAPGRPHILDSLGWTYYRQGRLREALRYLRRAAANSDSAEIAAHLGEVHWRLGEYAAARAAFAAGKERDPDNEVLNETLRRLRIVD